MDKTNFICRWRVNYILGQKDGKHFLWTTFLKIQYTSNGKCSLVLKHRIHQYQDGSYSLDQFRYAKTIIARFCPEDAPYGLPPHRNTPAPPDYIYSIKNKPTTQTETEEIKSRSGNLNFRSAICSLLYLALATRPDITFIICKLSKACITPGIKDYKALMWTLGYLQKRPNYGLKFYSNYQSTPVFKLLMANKINPTELIAFSDSSWQDCPDTSRSTQGNLCFFNGSLIDVNSSMATPVAMSSTKAASLIGSLESSIISAGVATSLLPTRSPLLQTSPRSIPSFSNSDQLKERSSSQAASAYTLLTRSDASAKPQSARGAKSA